MTATKLTRKTLLPLTIGLMGLGTALGATVRWDLASTSHCEEGTSSSVSLAPVGDEERGNEKAPRPARAKEDIKVTLSSNRKTYRVGESVDLILTIRNNGKAEFPCLKAKLLELRGFAMTGPDGKEAKPINNPAEIDHAAFPFTVQPGETVTIKDALEGINLSKNPKTDNYRREMYYPMVVPGTYRLRIKVGDWTSNQLAIKLLPANGFGDQVKELREKVMLLRVPHGGIQPQAVVDAKGTLHMIFFKGEDPGAGDLFYVRREAGTERFSKPLRINSRPHSSCAVGSVRGGQIALGKGGRVHVAWNGIGTDYARMNDAGTAFEEQRNLMQQTYVPDGGGTIAADDKGNVYVVWHGQRKGVQGEDRRQVWVASSTDEGKTFTLEAPAWTKPTGVCPCCSTRALADHNGIVYLMYRSATAKVNRDTYLLSSDDRGKTFHESLVHRWKVPG